MIAVGIEGSVCRDPLGGATPLQEMPARERCGEQQQKMNWPTRHLEDGDSD